MSNSLQRSNKSSVKLLANSNGYSTLDSSKENNYSSSNLAKHVEKSPVAKNEGRSNIAKHVEFQTLKLWTLNVMQIHDA